MSRIKALPNQTLRRLVWPLRVTRAGMVAERLTRGFWPVWTILFAILAALAFGLHDTLPLEVLWGAGVVCITGLVWAILRGVRRFRWPSTEDAMARLDSTLPGRPLSALTDDQAFPGDAGTSIVWQAHLHRMAERARAARAPAPDLRVAAADRFALRYVALAAFVVALLFGSIWRVAEVPGAVSPLSGADAAGPAFSWEAWAEPPPYTGRPSIYLNTLDKPGLEVPEGTRIILRLYGDHDDLAVSETVSASAQAAALPVAEPGAMRAVEFEAVRDGRLVIAGEGGREWTISVLPDLAPTVEITGEIVREADGRMSQPFTARDDYGVEGGRAIITLDQDSLDRRHGLAVRPEPQDDLEYQLPLPFTGTRTEFTEAFVEDASKHVWANLPVRMQFEVTDGRGQIGQSAPREIDLPGRRFFDPVAAALIEQRRDLLWTRENGRRVSQILHALTHRPEGLLRNERAYLMIRVAMRRLDAALAQGRLSEDMRDEMAEALWEIAELIEDGGLASALERMQQAQERLSEAIRNGASPEEIQKLMNELRQATDDYISQLAQNMERQGADEPDQQAQNGQQITGDQLQQMMDEIQRLMEEGRMAEAQELLDQLSRMMENLRVTEGQSGEGQQGPGGKAMEGLRETLRDQQRLSDDAFRDLQEQFGQQQGQQGQQQPGQQPGQSQPGEQGGPGQTQPGNGPDSQGALPGDTPLDGQRGMPPGSLADRQRSLREALREQEGNLPGLPSDEQQAARDSLGEAGDAMDRAEEALRDGDLSDALEQQAEAIENLREGLRNLGEALARDQQQQPGNQGQTLSEGSRDMPRDPLGRNTGSEGRFGTEENLLQGEDVYRRARDLLDEIRKRSSEQFRPSEELDYLKRLLNRF